MPNERDYARLGPGRKWALFFFVHWKAKDFSKLFRPDIRSALQECRRKQDVRRLLVSESKPNQVFLTRFQEACIKTKQVQFKVIPGLWQGEIRSFNFVLIMFVRKRRMNKPGIAPKRP